MKRLSLRLRLIILFSLLALLTWGVASAVAWNITRHNLNKVFDTQQMLFAKRLATANLGDISSVGSLPKTKSWCATASAASRMTTRWRSPFLTARGACC
ncbi:hypothetical protein GGER_42740 [Serratia rubidaea]